MLVITRRLSESITIQTPSGENLEIIVVQIKGGQTRIGVRADRDFKIDRTEILASDGGYVGREEIRERRKELNQKNAEMRRRKNAARNHWIMKNLKADSVKPNDTNGNV